MKLDRRALNDWVMGAANGGIVECILSLSCVGWKPDEITGAFSEIISAAHNEAIRAAGLNGGTPVANLRDHMLAWGQRQAGMKERVEA